MILESEEQILSFFFIHPGKDSKWELYSLVTEIAKSFIEFSNAPPHDFSNFKLRDSSCTRFVPDFKLISR